MHLCLASPGAHRLTRSRATAFALACELLAAGCTPRDRPPQVTFTWTVAPDPPRVGPAKLSVTLTHDARPVTGARVHLEGNMTHPGMKPVLAEAREVAPGRYEAELGLTMRGDWIVSVEATPKGGDVLRDEIRLRVNAGASVPNLGQSTPNLGASAPNLGHSPPSLGHSPPSLGQSTPSVGQSPPSLGQSAPSLGQSAPSVGQSAPSVGQSAPNVGAQAAAPSRIAG